MTHSAEYLAVIESDRWRAMGDERRRNNFCEMCKTRRYSGPLQLHHLHYWTLGCEEKADTILACERCHRIADKWRRAIACGVNEVFTALELGSIAAFNVGKMP